MDFRRLSEELCQIHFDHARDWNRACESITTHGEDGLMIWLLLGGDGAYSMDIARHFDLTAGRVANILRGLETKGYIARLQDRRDLRRAQIVLTPQGRAFARAKYEEMLSAHEKLLERMGEKDAETFVRLLNKVLAAATA